MKLLSKLVLVAVLSFSYLESMATIYQWYDQNGTAHFSDTPHRGAKKVDLPTVQTFDPSTTLDKQEKKQKTEDIEAPSYESITITQPENESTIPNLEGNVNIAIEVLPKLFEGDSIQLILDGKAVGNPQQNSAFSLTNVYRGAHTASVKILNKDKEEVISSSPVTFYVRRPIIKQNLPVNKPKVAS
jgi:hypothetical protein